MHQYLYKSCTIRKHSNKPLGAYKILGLLEGWGLIREGGAYLKFFDRQRQNCTISMEFEMLHSFNNNYQLLSLLESGDLFESRCYLSVYSIQTFQVLHMGLFRNLFTANL